MQNLLKALSREGDESWKRLLRDPSQPDPKRPTQEMPDGFVFPYQVRQASPYSCFDGQGRATMNGGVLQRDAVVWLREPLQRGTAHRRVTAFSHSAGVITMEAQALLVQP